MFVVIWATLLFAVRGSNSNTDVKQVKITGNTSVKEGGTLNLTCNFESSPQALITWTTLGSDKNLSSGFGMATLVFPNVTAKYSGLYICTAKHLHNTQTAEVNITVTYVKKSEITGKTAVKEGDALNLTRSVESFPPSLVMWTKVPSNKNLNSEANTNLQKNTGAATLDIPNVTAEDTGQYISAAKHVETTLTVYDNISVTSCPKILNSSGCINQSEVLTCMCISEGFPLPTIKWPLLENHPKYYIMTTVSHHTVNSTAILTVKDHSNTVECVSSNKNGEVKGDLIISKGEPNEEDPSIKLLRIVTRLDIIISFLIGALLSAIICCLARKCHRKKQKSYGNLAETLEMVTSHEDPTIDAGRAEEDYQAIDHMVAEAEGAEAAGKSDVEYSKIDFSLNKRKTPTEAIGTTETEYAEIKELKKVKEEAEETQDGEGQEEMIGEDEETKRCVAEEKEGEDVALYSNVKDIMSQV